jgi:hypothetical protein
VGVLRKKMKPAAMDVHYDRQRTLSIDGAVDVEAMPWVTRVQVLDVVNDLDTVGFGLRERMKTPNPREAAEKAAGDQRLGFVPQEASGATDPGELSTAPRHT